MSDREPPSSGPLKPLIDRLMHDQAQRWEQGERILVEAYLAQNPILQGSRDAVLTLIYHEMVLRRDRGEVVQLAEYTERFPQLSADLSRQWRVDEVLGSAPETVPPTVPPGEQPEMEAARLANLPSFAGYDIVRELGRGGMGIVYEAWDRQLKRIVALKMILAGDHADASEVSRFRSEAAAVARLQHPNIVQIFAIGEENGQPYFALEFVDGGNLARRLGGKPLLPREAAELVEPLARAIEAAHQHKVVHRDLKPANVLLAGGNDTPIGQCTPKITDFGLAKKLDEAGQTQSGAVVGTPNYMAPEQASGHGKMTGPPADVWALGAILYECLTGRPPFQGATVLDTLDQVRSQEPVPPSRLQPTVPRDLETICLKCLCKEPGKRYASAQALADDLGRFLNGEPIRARRAPVWERVVKWARRKPGRAALVGVGSLLLLLLAGGWLWYWDTYRRVKVEYYATMTKRGGAFEGVGRVTEEEARHRFLTYRFSRRAGLVEKVEIVNGHGELTPKHGLSTFIDGWSGASDTKKRECRYEYKRDPQGRVTEEIASDRHGEVVWVLHYTTNKDLAYYTNKGGFPCAHAPSGATYVRLVRDEEGREKEVRYLGKSEKPRPNRDVVFGARMEYNLRGLPERVAFLDAKDRPILNKFGVASITAEYDTRGNARKQRFLGLDNQPVLHKDGYAGISADYDRHGNVSELTYIGLDDRPTLHKDGYAKFRLSYDNRGNVIRVEYFDTDNKPTLHKNGYAAIARQYDGWKMTEETSIGLDGKPTLNKDGYATGRMKYDDRGNQTEMAYFDVKGERAVHKDGNWKVMSQYDDRGNTTEMVFFGLDDNPTLIKAGWGKVTYKYDDRGNQTEAAYFDVKGEPALHKDGNWKVIWQYDDRGNQTEARYFGMDDQPTVVKDGYSRVTFLFDDDGNTTGVRYFDTDNKRTLHKNGYAEIARRYDGWKMIEATYIGLDGHPTLTRNCYATRRVQHDERGNITELAYFDAKGGPALHKDGHWKVTRRTDDRGNIIEERFFGLDDRPTVVKNGYARVTMKYDRQNNQTEIANFGLKDEPVLHKQGHWKIRRQFDTRGNAIKEVYIDRDDQPMKVDGIAKIKMTYDPQGNKIEIAYFGLEDEPVLHREDGNWKVLRKYDSRGNRTEQTYRDRNDSPMKVNGVAKIKWTYDARGNTIATAFFGLKDERVRGVEGVWKIVRQFDVRGNETEEAYFDPSRKPMLVNGVARITTQYDNRGNTIALASFDQENKPTPHKKSYDGFTVAVVARTTFRYDDRGNEIEAAYFDKDGRPALIFGVAKTTAKHDPRGNEVERRFLDPDGKPTLNAYGYAKLTREYDSRGNKITEAYFDQKENPIVSRKYGCHKKHWKYDDRNDQIDVTYFDAARKELQARVLITKVEHDSQAQSLKLVRDDILVSYDGKVVKNSVSFIYQWSKERKGDKPKELIILRNGRQLKVEVHPGSLGIFLADKIGGK